MTRRFGSWTEGVSHSDRRDADLFFADLLGRSEPTRRRSRRRGFEAYEAEQEPLQHRCGFFGSGVVRTEAEVRAAVVASANTEWNLWHAAGRPRRENDAGMFGRLVRYYVSVINAARPDTLTTMWTNAAAATTNYAPLLAAGANVGNEARRIRIALLTGAPGATTPANLTNVVETEIRLALDARNDNNAWSAVCISAIVRAASINPLQLELMVGTNHVGRDKLLQFDHAHRIYTVEAWNRRRAGRGGSYYAYDPALRAPQNGDIIVQDRTATAAANVVSFADMPARFAQQYGTHGDIVVEVHQDHVVTIGGNLGGSVRKRKYPLDNGRLVRDRQQLYVQETDAGALPALPARSNDPLHTNSTARIVALLSPVIECAVIPGQRYQGGVIT